jgi:hypothetical protein
MAAYSALPELSPMKMFPCPGSGAAFIAPPPKKIPVPNGVPSYMITGLIAPLYVPFGRRFPTTYWNMLFDRM